MKKIFLLTLFVFIWSLGFTNSDKEIVIIKVEYSKKKDGFHSKLILEIGNSTTHSLSGKFQNDESGTVSFKEADGKLRVFSNEIDLMNFLFTLGYNYKEVYEFSLMSEDFYNFVLVKE